MTKLAPEWVRTSDPVIRSPARYRWTTAPANICMCDGGAPHTVDRTLLPLDIMEINDIISKLPCMATVTLTGAIVTRFIIMNWSMTLTGATVTRFVIMDWSVTLTGATVTRFVIMDWSMPLTGASHPLCHHGLIWFYWMFYDHFSARSLLAKLGRSWTDPWH